MRIAVARSRLRDLRLEMEQVGSRDEVDMLAQAEKAMNKGGSLAEWGCAYGRARSFIVEAVTNIINWRKQLAHLESIFNNSTQQLSRIQSDFPFDRSRRLAIELREYALEGAYNDERQMFLELSHILSMLLEAVDTLPDNKMAEAQFNKSKEQILAGIRETVVIVTELIDAVEEGK